MYLTKPPPVSKSLRLRFINDQFMLTHTIFWHWKYWIRQPFVCMYVCIDQKHKIYRLLFTELDKKKKLPTLKFIGETTRKKRR